MGGKALKIGVTRRYGKLEFETVSKELLVIIKKTFDRASTPLYYREKESFGDIDIIVDINGYDGIIRAYIESTFNPTEIFHNGNCYSFDYKEAQIDFICVNSDDYDSNYHYLAYNDLGNLIGRLAHRLGLKYGGEGLWYNYYDANKQNLGRIMISKNYRKIFEFLDLDYDVWLKGFDKLEDTFKYVTTSKYFDTDMFQFDSLNRVNRERNLKRASYLSFIDWINDVYPHKIGDKLDGDLIKIVDATFPEANFILNIKKLEYDIARKAYISAKFNGGIIMNLYGLKGSEIGKALTDFRCNIEADGYDFDEFILSETQENILQEFEYIVLKQI